MVGSSAEHMVLRTHDMYGHEIRPIGRGFGISLTHFQSAERLVPDFTFFHESDGFRQALFSVAGRSLMGEEDGPQIHNVFRERFAEVLALVESVGITSHG